MNLLDLYAKISLDTGEYDKGVKSATNSAAGIGTALKSAASSGGSALKTIDSVASSAAQTIGNVVSTVAKIGTAALGLASTGVVALTKTAVSSYADYEQLVGGVETLFGDSANTVKKYALNAFSTAGMTANTYMETVTSFSASLLQGLGGDTEAAAEMANMAITDMADNANKMGTDLSAIQTAYQGFAKQNYTMLDNLKLGYGGTKEEMERLLKKADELSESFNLLEDENGELVYSFDDIVEAIHVVQDDMGITGTTAAEASDTVSGSVATMKSAWQNLVGALGSGTSDMKWFVNNFVESAKTAAANVLPVVENAMTGISELVDGLAPVITEAIPVVVTDVVPTLLQAGADILAALVEGLVNAVPTLIDEVPGIIENLVTTIGEFAYLLWDAGVLLVSEMATAIEEDGPNLLETAVDTVMQFLEEKLGISEETLEAFEETMATVWESLGSIFESVKTAIDDVSTALSDSGVTWADVWNAISSVVAAAAPVVSAAIEGVGTAVSTAVSWLRQLSDWCAQHQETLSVIAIAFGGLAAAIGLMTAAANLASIAATVLSAAVTFLTSPVTILIAIFAACVAAGLLIAQNWDLIKEKANELADTVKEKFEEIKSDISEKLNTAKETALSVWDDIKSGIEEKINDAKDKVGEAIEKIKGFFDFEWSLPKLKLPHISITGSFSLSPLSVPKFSISWYKKAMDEAMLLDGATIFGAYGNTFLGGGEAGPEVVSGANTLMEMIREATGDAQGALLQIAVQILDLLSEYFPEIADNMTRDIVLDDGTLVGRLAPEIDEELGRLYRWNNR